MEWLISVTLKEDRQPCLGTVEKGEWEGMGGRFLIDLRDGLVEVELGEEMGEGEGSRV